MAKLTWLGEDGPEGPGPSYTIWNGVKFPKDEPIDTAAMAPHDAEYFIRKANANHFFRVDEVQVNKRPSGRAPKGKTWDEVAGEWVDEPEVSDNGDADTD